MLRTKIITAGLALSTAIALLVTGCGGSPRSFSNASMAAPSAAPQMNAKSAEAGFGMMRGEMAADMLAPEGEGNDISARQSPETEGVFAPAPQERKLVKHGDLSLETKSFDETLASLVVLVEDAGGYIDQQQVEGQSLRYKQDYYERSASITARIPANRLDEVTGKLGELCNVVSKGESISDITDSYYDAQSRLDTLKIKEIRLQELLAKAEKLEDVIALESALSDCQYQIDSLTGQLRRMDNQVSYSTLRIQLTEVVEYQEISEKPASFGQRLQQSLQYSGRSILRTLENCLFWLIEDGPQLLIILIFGGGLVYLAYRLWRRLRKNKPAMAKAAPYSSYGATPPVEPPVQEENPENP